MIQIDSSLLLQIVNFVCLIFILNFLLYKPMLAIMDKRKRRIEDSEEEIVRLKRTVEEKTVAYEDAVRSMRNAATGRNRELLNEASENAKVIAEEANREIFVMTEDFYGRMQREVQEARDLLGGQSRALSVEIAEKVLGRSIQ